MAAPLPPPPPSSMALTIRNLIITIQPTNAHSSTNSYIQLLQVHVGAGGQCNRIIMCEERKPTRCNNIDGLLSIMDVGY